MAGVRDTTSKTMRRRSVSALGAFTRLALAIAAIVVLPAPADGGVHMVRPSVASPSGASQPVVVTGVDFFQTPKTSCRFGGAVVRGEVVDENTFMCYPPPLSIDGRAGFVHVEVSMNALDFTSSGVLFEYVQSARVVGVAPRAGDANGGGIVTALAASGTSGFTPDARCAFSNVDSTSSSRDSSTSSSSTNDGDGGWSTSQQTWTADTGARFVSSAILTCVTPALRVGVSGVATATTQQMAHGNGDATLGAAVQWSAWLGASDELAAAATVVASDGARDAASVFSSPESGGSLATFFLGTGTSASADSASITCRFGTIAVVAYMVDPGSAEGLDSRRATVTCATPAGVPSIGTPAWVTVGISDRAPIVTPTMTRESSLLASLLTYVTQSMDETSAGVIRAVTPRRVATVGTPSAVVVTGFGFSQSASRCVVDGVASAPALVVSSALMLCELPAVEEPRVATAATSTAPRVLEAARADGATVTYAVEVVAIEMDVVLGATCGGAAITFTASAALPDGDAVSVVAARFGTLGPVATRFVSRFNAETVTPARKSGYVRARLDGGAGASAASSHSTLMFQYVESGEVVVATPSLVPVTGNVPVELFGWGGSVWFAQGYAACSFGAVPSDNNCWAPPGNVGFVAVAVVGAAAHGSGSAIVAYAPMPRVTGVAPRTNYARGGAVTTLNGADFTRLGAACAFSSSDSSASASARSNFVSSAVAQCETPALAPGSIITVEFTAGHDSSIRSASGMTVTILPTPRVLGATPNGGPLRGGDVIKVVGEHFVGVEPAACRIGSVGPLIARDGDVTGLDRGSTLECVAPARNVGAARVAVGARTGAGYTSDDVWYEYVSSIPVDTVVPSSSESGGAYGRALQVFGATLRFGERMPCVIGSKSTPGEVKRHGEMTCGSVAVESSSSSSLSSRYVGTSGRGLFYSFRGEGFFAVGAGGLRPVNGELSVVFQFRKPARVAWIAPRVGFVGGGTVVRVTGQHMSQNTGCAFGETTVFQHAVVFDSSAYMRCEAPGSLVLESPGSTVQFATSDASSAPEKDAVALAFGSIAEPTILHATPNTVSEFGGDVVSTRRMDSRSVSQVSVACSFATVRPVAGRLTGTDASLECVSPALKPGQASLRVGDQGGEFGRFGVSVFVARMGVLGSDTDTHDESLLDSMNFLSGGSSQTPNAHPVLYAAFPSVASSNGGTVVFVAGADFESSDGVTLGDVISPFALVVSSALAILETPPRTAVGGMGDVFYLSAVTAHGSVTDTSRSVSFAYAHAPAARSVAPLHVVAKHGGLVTVTGSFGDSQNAGAGAVQCRFGTTGPVDARLVDAANAECFAPAHAEGSTSLAVSTKGDQTYSFREPEDMRLEYVDEKEAASRDAREARGPEWLRVERAVATVAQPTTSPKGGGQRTTVSGENLGMFVAFGDAVVPVSNFVSSALVIVEAPSAFVASSAAARKTAAVRDVSRVGVRGFDYGFDRVFSGVESIGDVSNEPSAMVQFAYVDVSEHVAFVPRSATAEGGATLRVTLRVARAYTSAAACKVGTIGPVVGAFDAEGDAVCIVPASKPGAKLVSAGSTGARDASSWMTANDLLSVLPAPDIQHVVPSAATSVTKNIDVVGAWLDGVGCGEGPVTDVSHTETGIATFSAWTACTASALAVGRFDTSFVAVRLSGSGAATSHVILTRLVSPRIVGVSPANGGTEGGTVVFITGDGFFDGNDGTPPPLCAFSSTTEFGSSTTEFASAKAVSSAVARCETNSLLSVLPIGGGVVRTSVVSEGDEQHSSSTVTYAAAPTPWALTASPNQGSSAGGVSITVAVGGSVESVRRRSGDRGTLSPMTYEPGRSLSCAFGTVSPIAAQPADADVPRDIVCVSPAVRHGSVAPLRVFHGVASQAPPSPRAPKFSSQNTRVVVASLALATDVAADDSVQATTEYPPVVLSASPNVVLAGAGDVVRVTGANVHIVAALEWRCGAETFSSPVSVSVSSAVALFVTPVFDASTAFAVEAVPVTRSVSDDAVASGSLTVTPHLLVVDATPSTGSATGGALVTLATSPPLVVNADTAAACWFGTIGPVASRRGEREVGVACASPAGVAGFAAMRVAAAPGAVTGRAGQYGASFQRVVSEPAPATLTRSAVTTTLGGDAQAWVPLHSADSTYTSPTLVFGATALTTTRSNVGRGFLQSIRVPSGVAGGFVAVSLGENGATPFAHVLAASTPEPVSIAPSETVATGGGVVWVVGVNLIGGVDMNIATAIASVSGGDMRASPLVQTSSALAAFEAPPIAPGAATFRLSIGDSVVTSTALAFFLRYMGTARGPTTRPPTWFASPTAGGSSTTVFVDGDVVLPFEERENEEREFKSGAGCRFGTITVQASSATQTATACVAPALKPGVGVVETSFNGREWTNQQEVRFLVANPPTALAGVMPGSVPAGSANGALFGIDVVGAGLDRLDRVDRLSRLDRLDLFGYSYDFDDQDFALAAQYNVSIGGSQSGGVVAARVVSSSETESSLRTGVPDVFGFGFGFVAVAVDAFVAAEQSGASLEHLAVSVFSPPKVVTIDPPLGPSFGGTITTIRGADLRHENGQNFQAVFSAADGSGTSSAIAVSRIVSSAIAMVEVPDVGGIVMAADTVTVRIAAGVSLVSASTASVPSFVPTSSAATLPLVSKDVNSAIGTSGGSVVSVSFKGVAGGSGSVPFWCKFGSIGPVASRAHEPDGADTSATVTCVTPALAQGKRTPLSVSNNRRDWFGSVDFDTRGEIFLRSAAAARPQFAFPPATTAVGGGTFSGIAGITVTFDVPAPTSYNSKNPTGALGCAYGGTSGDGKTNSANVPANAITGNSVHNSFGRIQCAPASDPFMEGFFPLQFTLQKHSNARSVLTTDADPTQPNQISFEYVAAPRAYSVAPEIAHTAGGALLYVTGADLRRDGESTLVCAIANSAASASATPDIALSVALPVKVVSSALVVCELQREIPAGVNSVRVALSGADAFGIGALGASASVLVATQAPLVTDVSPVSISTTGGSVVTITGKRLRPVSSDDPLSAQLGTFSQIALRQGSGSEASFIAPSHVAANGLLLQVSRSLTDVSSALSGWNAASSAGSASTSTSPLFSVASPFVALRDGVLPSVVSSTSGAFTNQARVFVDSANLKFFTDGDKVSLGVVFSDGSGGRNIGGFQVVSVASQVIPDGSGSVDLSGAPDNGKGSVLTQGSLSTRSPYVQFETVSPARVVAVTPRVSSSEGGSLLDVFGVDFARSDASSNAVSSTATRVKFGPIVSHAGYGEFTVHVVSSAFLRVEVFGAHAVDSRVPVEVSVAPGFDSTVATDPSWSTDGVSVETRALPRVFRARPNFGDERGGVATSLTGTAFRDTSQNLKCKFGAVVVTASAYIDVNRVECVSPAKAPDGMSFDSPEFIQKVAPVSVSVNGRDFSHGAVGSGSPGVTLYDTTHSSGNGNTHVHSGRAASFAYGAALDVFEVDPARGPSSGGTDVWVRGANFLGPFFTEGSGTPNSATSLATSKEMERNFFFGCKFDQQIVAAAVGDVTASAALCRSPPHAAGFVAVEVRAGNSGNFTVFGIEFEFQAPAAAELLFPPVGAAGGGTLVSVTGANFVAGSDACGAVVDHGQGLISTAPSSSLKCRFGGGVESGAVAISSAVLRCETPGFPETSVDRALAVDVSTNSGNDYSHQRTYFEPIVSPFVLALEPRAGTAGGGTVVNVYGRGFTADAPVWCKFGTTGPIPAEYASEGVVRCKSPGHRPASRIPLEVSRGNVLDLTRDAVLFSV